MTHVTVLVRNPAQPDNTWEGLFLVDTGSVSSLVPEKHLRDIGLVPESRRTYELADGTEVKMDITTGDLEFMGEIVGAMLLFLWAIAVVLGVSIWIARLLFIGGKEVQL